MDTKAAAAFSLSARGRNLGTYCVIGLALASSLWACERLEFTRMVAHWAEYSDPGYIPFIEEAKPEIAQVGFYGGHFWSLAATPYGSGYPAHLPVRGHQECASWFKNLNAQLHERGVKAVGHLNVKFLVGDPQSAEGPRGFFQFYASQWDEQLLGPKPVADALDFLEKDAAGTPLVEQSYSIGGMHEYWACLNNPHWRQVLKAWVRFGIAQGVDGFISNYFYRHNCLCQYCVSGFRDYLRRRFTPEELKSRFSIDDLEHHHFQEIVGWHEPAQSTPLRREMLRFSQIANKNAFDEVLTQYGRSLKPDLIVAQWNHLGDFGQISGDERCLLPKELWGKDEDYLWYSTGDAANHTDLGAGLLGEGTLQARYIRGAFADKPFTLGKYESVRIRAAISELAANGGAPMGFYTAFKDPDARREIVRYYNFLRANDALFHGNHSYAEALLLFPRSAVHEGNLGPLEQFKKSGKALLDAHLLFDVLPDDLAGPTERARYSASVDPATVTASVLDLMPANRSRFEMPATVRVSASRPSAGNELTLHFVNYNREEPQDKQNRGSGLKDEKPIAVPGTKADLRVAEAERVLRVEFLAPEKDGATRLEFKQQAGRLTFEVPPFLVYGIARISFAENDAKKEGTVPLP